MGVFDRVPRERLPEIAERVQRALEAFHDTRLDTTLAIRFEHDDSIWLDAGGEPLARLEPDEVVVATMAEFDAAEDDPDQDAAAVAEARVAEVEDLLLDMVDVLGEDIDQWRVRRRDAADVAHDPPGKA